eukprot:CAMPEP_0170248108 /NCGR_PEP_ID=MMETSP0116_2-20130129/23846_1 /TAXON_ID=400756 /ORGANISM="Durinskia baltica, Strain CSIRO CS-38" /LENGTH=372 /DNA_ID=CAMNT_0010498995 /DNA_START=285 /DNA_END=1409 /DNA_ORIENTATION=-
MADAAAAHAHAGEGWARSARRTHGAAAVDVHTTATHVRKGLQRHTPQSLLADLPMAKRAHKAAADTARRRGRWALGEGGAAAAQIECYCGLCNRRRAAKGWALVVPRLARICGRVRRHPLMLHHLPENSPEACACGVHVDSKSSWDESRRRGCETCALGCHAGARADKPVWAEAELPSNVSDEQDAAVEGPRVGAHTPAHQGRTLTARRHLPSRRRQCPVTPWPAPERPAPEGGDGCDQRRRRIAPTSPVKMCGAAPRRRLARERHHEPGRPAKDPETHKDIIQRRGLNVNVVRRVARAGDVSLVKHRLHHRFGQELVRDPADAHLMQVLTGVAEPGGGGNADGDTSLRVRNALTFASVLAAADTMARKISR